MTIVKFKNFINLTEEEKLLVLEWRNSDRVRLKMINQDIILLENHLKFVNSLKNRTDCKYWLFMIDDVPVGVMDITEIDEKEKSCSSGQYIGNRDYNGFGILNAFLMFEYIFENLGVEKYYSTVLKNNERVHKLNKLLGGIDIGETENEYKMYWDRQLWEKTKLSIEPMIKQMYEIEEVIFEK